MNKLRFVVFFIVLLINNTLFASNQNLLNQINSELTLKEKQWIKNHPIIKVGNDKYWAPYDFYENGRAQGYNVEYLTFLLKNIGIEIEFVQEDSWNELVKKLKTKEIDILSGLENIIEHSNYAYFTDSFLTTFESIIIKKEDKFLSGYKDLFGKKVAVVKGYDYEEAITESYPQITLVLVNNALEGLKKVSEGHVDAFLENNDVAIYLAKKENINNLKLAGDSTFPGMEVNVDMQIAIRKDWPELYSILNKIMKHVPLSVLEELEQKWLNTIKNPTEEKIYLTREEKLKIKQNTFKVGVEVDLKPFNFADDKGDLQGISRDILKLISKKTGLKVEFVAKKSWPALLTAMKEEEIDILPAIYKNKEREDYMSFSKSFMEVKDYAFMRSDEEKIESLFDIGNKKVAVIDSFASSQKVINTYKIENIIKVKSIEEGITALLSHEVDIFIEGYDVVNYYLRENKIKGIKATISTDYQSNFLHFGVGKKNKLLSAVINRALINISEEELNKIFNKWLQDKENDRIFFTKKEKRWLKNNRLISYSAVNWEPLTIINGNKKEGIIADYLSIVEKYTGISFVLKKATSWTDVLNQFKQGKIDLVPSIGNSQYEKSLGLTSDEYVTYPMAIVTNNQIDYVDNIDEIKDKTFSIPKNYTSYNFIKTLYPSIKLLEASSIEEALLNVSSGKADVFLGHLATSIYGIKKLSRNNLKISGYSEFNFSHHFLISEKHPEFVSIVNKIFKKISKKDKNNIYYDWIKAEVTSSFDYSILWKVGVVLLFILVIIFYYTQKIKKQKVFVETVVDSQEQMIIITNGEKLLKANKTFLTFFNIENKKAFKNKIARCIGDTFDKNSSKTYLQKQINGIYWADYILANPDKTHKARILNNNKYSVFSVTATLLPEKDKSILAVFTDITEIESSKNDIENVISSVLLPVIIITKEEQEIKYLNKYAEEILETSLRNSIGKNFEEVFYIKDGNNQIIERLEVECCVKNFENIIHLRKSGKEFISLLSVSKIQYQGVASYIGMFIDITKMKEMENQIRISHKQTKDSIKYASLIQETFIPEKQDFKNYFSDSFTIWQPKDIVGGDVYLLSELRHEDECLLFVIDCTGHGVPGAFVTMLVKAIERQIVTSIKYNPDIVVSPSEILSVFNKNMKNLLKQNSKESISNAGFDGGVMYYNKKESLLKFAGAYTSLFYTKDNELTMIKGDRQSIGYKKSIIDYDFNEYSINAEAGMNFYLSTDGYTDQNGGEKELPFGRKRFVQMLEKNHSKGFAEQKEIMINTLNAYQGNNTRNDDVTVVGLKI